MAYHQGTPVGWCNANDRNNYQRMIQYKEIIEPSEDKICTIVCFLVHPDFRQRGQEEHYMGPPDLYLSRGFEIMKESEEYYLVRKSPGDRRKT